MDSEATQIVCGGDGDLADVLSSLSIWEDVVDLRFVTRVQSNGRGEMIHVTPAGQAFLRSRGRTCDS